MSCDSVSGVYGDSPIHRVSVIFSSCLTVFGCIFSKISISSGNGGAILVNDLSKTYYSSECSFSYCSAINGQGGATYLCCQSMRVLRCCAMNCFALSYHYSIHSAINGYEQSFNFSSYYRCPPETITSHTIVIHGGCQTISFINSSHNYVVGHSSGIQINEPAPVVSTFNTICNCSAENVIVLNAGTGTNLLSYYNIVNNKPTKKLFYCYLTYTISHSILILNTNIDIHYPSTGVLYMNDCSSSQFSTLIPINHEYIYGCETGKKGTNPKKLTFPILVFLSHYCLNCY